jgi:hypothetical protein
MHLRPYHLLLCLVSISYGETLAEEEQLGASKAPSAFDEVMGRRAMLDYSFEPESTLADNATFTYWDVRLSTPVYGRRLSPSWIFGARFRYRIAEFDWQPQEIFDNSLLHRVDLQLALIYKPETSKWISLLAAGPALVSDLTHITSDDVVFVAMAGIGYQFSPEFTLLAGAYFSQDFGSNSLFPGPGLVWEPTPKWLISFVPPRLRIAYSPNDRWKLALDGFPNGDRWSITTRDGQSAFIDREGLRLGLRLEYQVFNASWIHLGAGWMFERAIRVVDSQANELYSQEADSAPYLMTGFTWRF